MWILEGLPSLKWLRDKWLSNREGLKDRSDLSLPIPQTRSEDQLPASQPLGQASGSQLSQPEHLYWISYRKQDDSFLGVVIAKGKSPGDAASRMIDRLELQSCRASIVMIPPDKEIGLEYWNSLNRLLTEEEATNLLKTLDISINRS